MANTGFMASVRRSLSLLCSRKIYLVSMIIVPMFMAVFFLSLLDEGLPLKVPTAIVDLDRTSMSRDVIRSLKATEHVGVTLECMSHHEALDKVKSGEIFGFFVIPQNFQRDAVGGRTPTINYYSNMTYYVPGTFTFKGFKTIAVGTSAGVTQAKLSAYGIPAAQASILLQPLSIQDHPVNNPWLNYSIYLSNSFIPGVIALMVMLVTVYSICEEIKRGTSPQWIATARGSIMEAVAAKLLPQTVIFSIVGIACQSMLYGFSHFPMHCSAWHMILAMVLMVIACQAFALFVVSVVPNLRLGLSMVALVGILSFSITGFSFPVQSMYGGIAIFSYLIPLRYYFLIYIDQALNGIPMYYSRMYYAALILFPLFGGTMLWKLKRHCLNPVYVP